MLSFCSKKTAASFIVTVLQSKLLNKHKSVNLTIVTQMKQNFSINLAIFKKLCGPPQNVSMTHWLRTTGLEPSTVDTRPGWSKVDSVEGQIIFCILIRGPHTATSARTNNKQNIAHFFTVSLSLKPFPFLASIRESRKMPSCQKD